MTLKPQPLTPHSMQRTVGRKGKSQPHMVIDLKHQSQWGAIHEQGINGVAYRRRPIRALESFLESLEVPIAPQAFSVMQSQLRRKLKDIFAQATESGDMRAQFLMNDLAGLMRIMIGQSQSRNFMIQINQGLDYPLTIAPTGLALIVTYRDVCLDFAQSGQRQDETPKDLKTIQPYGALLVRGASYDPPVYWRLRQTGAQPFSIVITPSAKRG